MPAGDRVCKRRTAAALARHYRDAEALSIGEISRRLGRAEATVKAYLYDPSQANKRPTHSPTATASLGSTRAAYGAPVHKAAPGAQQGRTHAAPAWPRQRLGPIPSGARARPRAPLARLRRRGIPTQLRLGVGPTAPPVREERRREPAVGWRHSVSGVQRSGATRSALPPLPRTTDLAQPRLFGAHNSALEGRSGAGGRRGYRNRGIAQARLERAGEPKQSCRAGPRTLRFGDGDREVDDARGGRRRQ